MIASREHICIVCVVGNVGVVWQSLRRLVCWQSRWEVEDDFLSLEETNQSDTLPPLSLSLPDDDDDVHPLDPLSFLS